jgi:hypothetical protein
MNSIYTPTWRRTERRASRRTVAHSVEMGSGRNCCVEAHPDPSSSTPIKPVSNRNPDIVTSAYLSDSCLLQQSEIRTEAQHPTRL